MALEKLPTDAARLQIEKFPAVSALGYALHSLAAGRPWLESANPSPKSYLDFQESEQQEAFREVGYYDAEHFDSGDTIGTL